MSDAPPWDPTSRPDVAILIALPEEFRTLAADLNTRWFPQPNANHPGSDFLFSGPNGYRCVAAIMSRMGPTVAASTAMRLLAWKPAVIINIGIAGGFKDDLRIGDVIVPREVAAYDETAKVRESNSSQPWERRGSDYRPTATLVAEVHELEFTAGGAFASWRETGRRALEALRVGADQNRIAALVLREHPIISTAHLASGSFVVASKTFAEFIRQANADIHAGEMEAAGMMAAAEYHRNPVATLVVRGISDHVDADKKKVDEIGEGALRRLAMANAWRLVCLLMELGKLPRSSSDAPRSDGPTGPPPPAEKLARPSTSPEYVFIAHAGADKLLVSRLCRGLLARGVRPWLDAWDLAPGKDWATRLREALVKAPTVVVCDGPHGSGFEQREYEDVLRSRVEAEPGTVVRVRLPGAPAVLDFDGSALDEDNWTEGIDALASRLGIDDERDRWRSLEAASAGVSERELVPYRGLEPFREVDARWMFGRDEEVGNLLALAEKHALLTVIGASGSGKSSLVMAGLCPALRNGALHGERVEAIAYLRPGKNPCEELARALSSFSPTEDPVARAKAVADLRDDLLKSTDRLRLVVSELVSDAEGRPVRKVLLVVDQLEELFTQAGLGRRDESPEAMPFVRNIIEATKDADAPLWIVSTLRADFLPNCLAAAELARTLNSGTYFALPPMREDQLRDAIELPARRVGFEIEPRLVEKLVAGAADQAGRLPLLEHVLRELWQRRDEQARTLSFAEYVDAGGLEGAIAKAADRALSGLRERLGERAMTVTQRVMTRLVHIGLATQVDTRQRATLDELGRDEETRQVLDAFVRDARVLVSDEVGGVVVIEIAHEALLREWQTLVGWLDANRGALRLRQELAEDAVQYEKRRDAEFLWGKGRIDEARRVLAESTVELNAQEGGFLQTSVRAVRARTLAVWGSVVTVILVLVGALAFIGNLNANNERQARENERQALANAKLAESEQTARQLAEESAASEKGLRASMLIENNGYNFEAAVLGIQAVGALGPDEAHPPTSAAYEALLKVAGAEPAFEVVALRGHSESIFALAFSPGGSRLATASYDKTVRLWDVASGTPLATLNGHSSSITALAFSPDGCCLATASSDNTARLWDVTSGKSLATLNGHSSSITALAFSSDGSHLATASYDNTARLWEVASGKPLATLDCHSSRVEALAFSPDGSHLAGASYNTARLWDVTSGKPLATLDGLFDRVDALAFSPDGSHLATAFDNTARLWHIASGKSRATLEGHSNSVNALAFSPDGSRFATASDDYTTRLWDVASGKPLATLEVDPWALAFSPDGSRFATASSDGTRLWDIASGKPLATLDLAETMAFSPDGSRFATASVDYTARLWDVAPGKPLTTLEGHGDSVNSLAFSPDGSRIATASDDHTARLWDVVSGNLLATHTSNGEVAFSPDGARLATPMGVSVWLRDVPSGKHVLTFEGYFVVSSVTFSPDGSRLAGASSDNTARLWDVTSGKTLAALEGHFERVNALAFSPDGSRLATAGNDYTPRLWDVASGKPLATFDGHTNSVTALAFSPDGSRLATASWDGTARLWNVATGKPLATFDGHTDSVTALAFSPNGSRLATASRDGTVRLWDVASGKTLATFDGHAVNALAFSPDGSRLAIAIDDNTVRLWPMPALALKLVCQSIKHATRYPEVAPICDPLTRSTQ